MNKLKNIEEFFSDFGSSGCQDQTLINKAIDAHAHLQAIRLTHVLVPREPTTEMIRAGLQEYYHPEIPDIECIYAAMIKECEGE